MGRFGILSALRRQSAWASSACSNRSPRSKRRWGGSSPGGRWGDWRVTRPSAGPPKGRANASEGQRLLQERYARSAADIPAPLGVFGRGAWGWAVGVRGVGFSGAAGLASGDVSVQPGGVAQRPESTPSFFDQLDLNRFCGRSGSTFIYRDQLYVWGTASICQV